MRDLCSIPLVLAVLSMSCQAGELAKRVSVCRVPGSADVVKALTSADGTIHLLVDLDDAPRYLTSRDGGATFSAPMAIVDAASQKPGLKFSAWDMAVGKDGRVHVAMGNNAWKLKLPEEEWSLYYASLAPGAKAFSPVRNLNRKPSEGFSLAANERGDVAACFLSGKLFAMISHDEGKTFGASAEPNPDWDPCNCCTTAAAYGPDGRLALLYREETNNDRDMYVVLWDQRGEGKAVRKRVSGTPWKIEGCPMTYFSINRTETGYVAAWPTKGQVYFARLDKNGAVLPPGEIRAPGTAGMRTGIVALGAADGITLAAWKNQSKDSLRWQVYDPNAKPEGEPGSTKSSGAGAAAVALSDGRFLVFP
jgi:hypothetical protein